MSDSLRGDPNPGVTPFELFHVWHPEVGTDGDVLPVDEDDAIEFCRICGTDDVGPCLVGGLVGRLDVPEPVETGIGALGRRIADCGPFEEVFLCDEPPVFQVLDGCSKDLPLTAFDRTGNGCHSSLSHSSS